MPEPEPNPHVALNNAREAGRREAVAAQRDELKGVREMLRRECVDWAEDHTYAQTVAKRVGVAANKVEGDSYGVPGIQDLIDMIAERIPPNKSNSPTPGQQPEATRHFSFLSALWK